MSHNAEEGGASQPAKSKRGREEGDGTENVINSQIVVTFFFPSPSRRPLLVFSESKNNFSVEPCLGFFSTQSTPFWDGRKSFYSEQKSLVS